MDDWTNNADGGTARTGDNRRPEPYGRPYQPSAPGDHDWNGRRPDPSPRLGESRRHYRRARVTAS